MDSPQALVDEFAARRAQRYEKKRTYMRQDHPRASAQTLCAREMYHQCHDWDKKPLPDVKLLQRFERGKDIEILVSMGLARDGWPIVEGQAPFEIRETIHAPQTHGGHLGDQIICTGHIDGRIDLGNGRKPVFEIKSLHPHIWGRIETADDFFKLGSFWARYPLQVLLYCYAYSEPWGMFVLDDCLGHVKLVPLVLEDHLDETEGALGRCRAATIGQLGGDVPDYCGDTKVCMECWCRQQGLCMPPLDFTGDTTGIIDDPLMALDLSRMEELKGAHLEYVEIERDVKGDIKCREVGDYVCGEFLIHAKGQTYKRYDIPSDVKAKYTCEGTRRITTWERLVAIQDAAK